MRGGRGRREGEKLTVWGIGVNLYCDCCKDLIVITRLIEIFLFILYVSDLNQDNKLLHILIDGIINYVNIEGCNLSNYICSMEGVLEVSVVAKVTSCI